MAMEWGKRAGEGQTDCELFAKSCSRYSFVGGVEEPKGLEGRDRDRNRSRDKFAILAQHYLERIFYYYPFAQINILLRKLQKSATNW